MVIIEDWRDDEDIDEFLMIGDEGRPIAIPTVMISKEDGTTLRA
jgi:hypothetical protein